MYVMNKRNLLAINRLLKEKYKSPRHGNKSNPLDELFFIVLSGATIEKNFGRAYSNLKRKYARWRDLLRASPGEVFQLIKHAGLGRKKAIALKRIVSILEKRSNFSLSYLKDFQAAEAIKELTTLPGVGVKSAKCVLMYSFKKPVFPVDTHVFKIMRRVGFLGSDCSLSCADKYLERVVPDNMKYDLHVNLVALGRKVCVAKRPKCEECCVRKYCNYGRKGI